jgi:hypothetical protein
MLRQGLSKPPSTSGARLIQIRPLEMTAIEMPQIEIPPDTGMPVPFS